jgi:hypothetical protein
MMIDEGGGREECRGKLQPFIIPRNAPAANCPAPFHDAYPGFTFRGAAVGQSQLVGVEWPKWLR